MPRSERHGLMHCTIPLRIHCLVLRDRSTPSPPQPIARAEPTQRRLQLFSEFSVSNRAAKNGLGVLASRAISKQPSHGTFMRCTSLVAACSAVLGLLSMLTLIKESPGTAWSRAAGSAPPALETVNRSGKADRMPLLTAIRPHRGLQFLENYTMRNRASAHQLTDGCESLVSELSQSVLAQIARRCIS
jgi:hypothetical protein